MKKLLLSVLTVCLLTNLGFAQEASVPADTKKCGQKKIKSNADRSTYYKKLADDATKKGDQNLAEVYNKCADAKSKIANGMKEVYDNSMRFKEILASDAELKASICDKKMKNCLIDGKAKGKRFSTYIKKIKEYADKSLAKAKQADSEGKVDLAKKYNELASVINAKAEGLKLVAEGKKEFKLARKEFKALKKSTSDK